MDYQKIAGGVLFGADVLDNAMRGVFIEAIAFHALSTYDAALGTPPRWRHVGLGWGPWDLQRGTAKTNDRVRVQVKAKAAKQLWTPQREREPYYELGVSTDETAPAYFARDYPVEIFGECEASGYRTDLFLLAWHTNGTQSDPTNYDYFIVPVSELARAPTLPKRIAVRGLSPAYTASTFADLPERLNAAAEACLSAGAPREAAC